MPQGRVRNFTRGPEATLLHDTLRSVVRWQRESAEFREPYTLESGIDDGFGDFGRDSPSPSLGMNPVEQFNLQPASDIDSPQSGACHERPTRAVTEHPRPEAVFFPMGEMLPEQPG